jgi:geranylgeranyl diphosphate synthase type II
MAMTSEQWWKRRTCCTQAMLSECLSNGMGSLHACEPKLAAAIRDAVSNQGSMTRCVTAYFLSLEMGLTSHEAKSLACGVEYLHLASLVFDDMPWMDDAQERRNRPCLHVEHGEAIATLASLALINRGYSLLWQSMAGAELSRREMAGRWIEDRLGPIGMIGGQSFDLVPTESLRDAAEVERVAARKTGDLLRLTIVLPAIIGRGTEREIERLDRLAHLRGVAYQLADDLKDVMMSASESGKTPGRDHLLGRPNMIMSAGFQEALRRFKKLRRCGDRVEDSLPGSKNRWGMLKPLRVKLPTISEEMSEQVHRDACAAC